MYNNIFITGSSGSGKSYAISSAISSLENKPPVYGFYTKRILSSLTDNGMIYIYSASDENPKLTPPNCIGICGNSSPLPLPQTLETIGVSLLSNIPIGSLVVMDELGLIENDAPLFRHAVLSVLNDNYCVIGAIKQTSSPFLDSIKNHPRSELFSITTHTKTTVVNSFNESFLKRYTSSIYYNQTY